MRIGRVELVDSRTVGAVNAYKGTDYAAAPTLFLEFSGSEAGVESDIEVARETSAAEGCTSFEFEADEEAREKPGGPPRRGPRHQRPLPRNGNDGHGRVRPDLRPARRRGTPATPSSPAAWTGPSWATSGTGTTILPRTGTRRPGACRGGQRRDRGLRSGARWHLYREHGIGMGKTGHLQKEHGDSLPFMREIKRIADPKGIMNPGKIFSSEYRLSIPGRDRREPRIWSAVELASRRESTKTLVAPEKTAYRPVRVIGVL